MREKQPGLGRKIHFGRTRHNISINREPLVVEYTSRWLVPYGVAGQFETPGIINVIAVEEEGFVVETIHCFEGMALCERTRAGCPTGLPCGGVIILRVFERQLPAIHDPHVVTESRNQKCERVRSENRIGIEEEEQVRPGLQCQPVVPSSVTQVLSEVNMHKGSALRLYRVPDSRKIRLIEGRTCPAIS